MPPIDLRNMNYAHMRYSHWYWTMDGRDGGNISISKDNGETWDLLGQSYDYNTKTIVGLNNQKGWSGFSSVWVTNAIDLTPHCGGIVLLRFNFGTDNQWSILPAGTSTTFSSRTPDPRGRHGRLHRLAYHRENERIYHLRIPLHGQQPHL